MAALGGIADWSNARDIPFATYVWRRRNVSDDLLWSDLQALGAERGFPVVEVVPAWVDVDLHRLSVVDGHPDAAGHLKVARGLANDLRDRGWLDPAR